MRSITEIEGSELFFRFYSMRTCVGNLVLPEKIEEWAKSRFGDCERQKIVRITNRFTGESTLFNELRAKRPLDSKSEVELDVEDCAFCNPLNRTPSDTFGRVEGKHCITASNIAKYDCVHAVIIFREHNPLVRDSEVIEDIIDVACRWFDAANKRYPAARYPFFMWNCLWRAGASIIHGHAQALLSEEPYSKPLQLSTVRENYRKAYGSEYLEDLFKVHEELGLGFEVDGVKVFAHLTPVKEKEVLMIAEEPKQLALPLSKALNCYYSMGVMSFNVAIYLPPLGENDLVLLRLVDRGYMGTKTADIGGMELYAGVAVVSSDPFAVAEKLRKFL